MGQTERRMQWLQQHGYVRRDEQGNVFYPPISMALLGGVDPQRVQDACTRAMRDGAHTKAGMLVCTLPDELMRDLKRGANGLQAQYNTTDAVLILYMEAQRYERAQGARRTR